MSLREAMDAVRATPKDSHAWSNLGDTLVAAGQLDKARESYQRALQLDPLNAAAQAGLASALTAEREEKPGPPPSPAPRPAVPPITPPRAAPAPASPVAEPAAAAPSPRPATSTARREPPPWPEQPGKSRVLAGVLLLLLFPLLCLCTAFLAVARMF